VIARVAMADRTSGTPSPPRDHDVAARHASVGAVIVLFHPDWQQTARQLISLADQTEFVVLVDNTPGHVACPMVIPDQVTYLPLGANTGIAYAQNRGAEQCKGRGVDFVVFFDQDSEIDPYLIPSLLSRFHELIARGRKVAAVGPRPFDVNRSRLHIPLFSTLEHAPNHCSRVTHLLSSGSLVPIEALDTVGPMDESLFIDCVDQEWGWRADGQGWHCFVDESVTMQHRMGLRGFRLPGLSYAVPSPERLYYQFRNPLRLIFHYPHLRVPKTWLAKRLLALPLKFAVNSMFLSPRATRTKHMINGIRDGLRDYGGIAPRVPERN
jgi:rhamnosyltransferase